MNTDLNTERILEIGVSLSTETNRAKLLHTILTEAMNITHADAGTLYTLEKGELAFRIMCTRSLGIDRGGDGSPIDVPPVPLQDSHVAGYVALHNEMFQTDDVYHCTQFDFSGPRRYDERMGYRSKSMFVAPLRGDENETIGVLQLLNAQDDHGEVTAFPEDTARKMQILLSFSSVALSGMRHRQEIKRQMFSFFKVIITAIDERTPYNASHTKRIVEMLLSFIDYATKHPEVERLFGKFDDIHTECVVMCAWLHDIGKLVTPLSVINKVTRLGGKEKDIRQRFMEIEMLARLDWREGRCDEAAFQQTLLQLEQARSEILRLNSAKSVEDSDREQIHEIGSRQFRDLEGNFHPWLTDIEIEDLCIPHGTLNREERKIMEAHASITSKLLSQIDFTGPYTVVQRWAGSHHEKLDGSGYPQGLTAEQITPEVRLLTILDIFEALTTDERPYKEALSVEQSFAILHEMAEKGEISDVILKAFQNSKAWEAPLRMENFIEEELTKL